MQNRNMKLICELHVVILKPIKTMHSKCIIYKL